MARRTAQIVLTPALARAAGMDAGNFSMRKAGRTVWSVDDYNAAAATTNQLLDILEPEVAAYRKLMGHS
jgi:hypothetical protein